MSTLPGKSVLFNFDGPDNVSALRVPYKEVLRLEDYWLDPFDFGKVLVANYTATVREIAPQLNPIPRRDLVDGLIKDINSIGKNLGLLNTPEGMGNIVFETLGSLGDAVLDWVIANNGRGDTQIQDYRPAMRKVASIFGAAMSLGLNVVVTGHLQSERDEITQRGKLSPLIWGKIMPDTVPRMFGEVFQSLCVPDGKGGVKYQWLTKPDPAGFIGFLGTRKLDADKLPKYIDQDYSYLDKEAKEFDKKKGAK